MKPRLFVYLLLSGSGIAQTPFSSGSNGSDKALNYTTPGQYNFDPVALGLNPAGDNIFNFTSINIASGVVLALRNSYLRGKPVIWLATGDVNIAGDLVLDGQNAPNLASYGADWISYRVPSEPGPGGFSGGVGALQGAAPSPGLGPGGAPVQANSGCSIGGGGSFATAGIGTPPAPIYGNGDLVPLIGGSGGSGGCVAAANSASDAAGGTGGAGGGAIRIVSTTSITVTGRISAAGGLGGGGRSNGSNGGSGSGGAIHLIAPSISGGGQLYTFAGGDLSQGSGYVALNAANNTFSGIDNYGPVTKGPLFSPPLPTPSTLPALTIASVNGVNVAQPPHGAFQTADVTINASNTVAVAITASGVPLGTVVKLLIQSEFGTDQSVNCTPLAGSVASSSATCNASFPTSWSHILASVSW